MTAPESISEKLNHFGERLQTLDKHAENQRQLLISNTEFNTTSVKNDLEEDLRQIESSIVYLSKICLKNMVNSNEKLTEMETDLQHIDGSLQAIRANAGRQLLTSATSLKENSKIDDQFLPPSIPLPINYPKNKFQINLGVISRVGRNIDETADAGAENMKPLILKVDPGSPQPSFWNRTTDFFLPVTSASKEEIATSFSDYYGFDPIDANDELNKITGAQGSAFMDDDVSKVNPGDEYLLQSLAPGALPQPSSFNTSELNDIAPTTLPPPPPVAAAAPPPPPAPGAAPPPPKPAAAPPAAKPAPPKPAARPPPPAAKPTPPPPAAKPAPPPPRAAAPPLPPPPAAAAPPPPPPPMAAPPPPPPPSKSKSGGGGGGGLVKPTDDALQAMIEKRKKTAKKVTPPEPKLNFQGGGGGGGAAAAAPAAGGGAPPPPRMGGGDMMSDLAAALARRGRKG